MMKEPLVRNLMFSSQLFSSCFYFVPISIVKPQPVDRDQLWIFSRKYGLDKVAIAAFQIEAFRHDEGYLSLDGLEDGFKVGQPGHNRPDESVGSNAVLM